MNQVYTHNFKSLVSMAGLSGAFKTKEDADSAFAAKFAIAAQWRPEVRYEADDPTTAQTMMTAINHQTSGVLPWIKLYW